METRITVQQSMRKHWPQSSVPSFAAHDSTVRKKEGKLLRNLQVRNKVNGKRDSIDHQRVQKRFPTEISSAIYEN